MSAEPGIFGVAARDVARLQTVARIVVKHGFGEMLTRLPFAAQLLGGVVERVRPEDRGTAPERFARLLGELGPTYIKLGQVLSMRSDLLPPDYVQALTRLQDRAPVIPIDEVRRVVAAGLGRPVEESFAEFDEAPLATASVAQTHLARTRDGKRVVVKVQRPGIVQTMRGDLDLLYLAARGLEAGIEDLRLVSPSSIVAEFEKALLRELDFTEELSNLLRMRDVLAHSERKVTVPHPLPELSCRTVLTMTYFEGRPVRDLEAKSELARAVVETVIDVMTKSILVDGFFHGDPHAGNLLVGEDGTLCFLDLGLVGTLSPEQRDDIVTLVFATILDDASTVARVLLKMGTPTQRVNIAELKREISRVRAQYVMVRSVADLDSRRFVEEFANAAHRYRVRLATEYSVLVKSVATIEGLVRRLHPDVDAIALIQPHVERVFRERWAPQSMLQNALGGATGAASLLRAVPNYLDQILHDVETGNVQVRPLTPKLDTLPDRLHQSATRVGVAIFAAAMSICAAVVVPDDLGNALRWFKLLLFVVFTLFALLGWSATWWWHFLGQGTRLRLSPLLKLLRRR
jgi:ubiquinone biosynthesis protein